MKKLFTLILGIAFVYSCSTSSDENGNSNTTVVPFAPSNLTGTVASTSQINLTWTDNSTNETGFKIERKTGTGTYAVVGTTATDVTTFVDSELTPSTTYTYRVYSNNAVGNSLTYSNELTLTTTNIINLPTLTTTTVSSISATTIVSGGTISNDGGAAVTARGVCWSTSSTPTISLSTKTNDGTGTGSFTSNLTVLTANTTYYIRSYAINNAGISYGNEVSFTTLLMDLDGNIYSTVNLCGRIFTKSNLNVSHYKNGDIIPQVTDPAQWANLTTGAWCYYGNDPANESIYGKLYNWYAVNDPRGLAPLGWHIPTDEEWRTATICLGGESGNKMKATILWVSQFNRETNSSQFTGLPGGYLNFGAFFNKFYYGCWWSSSEYDNIYAKNRTLISDIYTSSNSVLEGRTPKTAGYSVRCIRD